MDRVRCSCATPLEERADRHGADRNNKEDRADGVHLGWHANARRAPHEHREGGGATGGEVGDDKVVNGEAEGQEARRGDAREDQREGDAPEGLLFIPASKSPINQSLIVTSNENDGTIKIYKTTKL